MKVEKVDATLDCTSLFCPMPIIKTAEKIKELKVNDVLAVLADDEGIKEDMPAWCESTGNELLGFEEDAGLYRVYVRKKK